MAQETQQDRRYEYVRCPKCDLEWQRIDWGCAAHELRCGYPVPAQPPLADEPQAEGRRVSGPQKH